MTTKVRLKRSAQFEKSLSQIEDFIFSQRQRVEDVERFLDQIEHVTEFVRNNPKTPALDPKTGDRSWPFGEGDYRLYFANQETNDEVIVLLSDVDASKAANLDRYPEHEILPEDTFETDQ